MRDIRSISFVMPRTESKQFLDLVVKNGLERALGDEENGTKEGEREAGVSGANGTNSNRNVRFYFHN